jgi:hypothetical protein
LWVKFPNAIHVTAINCQFIAVKGTQYNVFLNASDAGPCYVSPSFQTMFPNAASITMKGCCLHDDFDGCHVMTHDSLGSGIQVANFSANTDFLHATDVTVNGLVFIGVSGTQYNMFLSESTMITCSRDDCDFFKDYRDNSILGTNFFMTGPQIYNSMELDSPFIRDKLLLDAYGQRISGTPQSFIKEPFILSYSCLQRTRSCLQIRQDDEDPMIPLVWEYSGRYIQDFHGGL